MIMKINRKRSDHKHNFFAFLWHGVFLQLAGAFTQINTVQTALIHTLTGSPFLSGLMMSMHRIGHVVPQLFFVNWVERTPRKKNFLIAAVLIRGLSLLTIALILWLLYKPFPVLSIVLILLFSLLFFLTGGMGDVSYFAVFSKTIKSDRRGTLYGLRLFFGGLLGLGAGYLTKIIFSRVTDFPHNYMLLYILSAVAMFVAFAGFYQLREKADSVKPKTRHWYKHFVLLKGNPYFVRLIITELMLTAAHIAFPLYILFARTELDVSEQQLGWFVTAQIAGEIIAGPLWGRLGDRVNFRLVLVLIGITGTMTPLLAIFLPLVHIDLYLIVFFLVGTNLKGLSLGVANYLMILVPNDSIPSHVAVKNMLQFPTIFYPLMGGILVAFISYQTVFWLVSAMLFAGTLLSVNLYCVRSQNKQRMRLMRLFD
ncbi:MAG: MFS transporter [Caldithrix sp.]|nr:MFS transporter [Caldithrix sp.]